MSDQSDWTTSLQANLGTTIIGHTIQFFPSVGSTNDLLKRAARSGGEEGLVFVTDEQVAGRGRYGRTWTAPAGTSLLVSILVRPGWLPAADAFRLTMLASVAAAEALETAGELVVDLKWPNDLQIKGRKVGGILVEAELDDAAVHWAVIGCGINVNWNPQTIPELSSSATSISAELGHPVSRRHLLAALLGRLDARYLNLRHGARSALFDAWRNRLQTLGRVVRAETPQGTVVGVAEDVASDGALLLRDQHGQQHRMTAGDVSIRPAEV